MLGETSGYIAFDEYVQLLLKLYLECILKSCQYSFHNGISLLTLQRINLSS